MPRKALTFDPVLVICFYSVHDASGVALTTLECSSAIQKVCGTEHEVKGPFPQGNFFFLIAQKETNFSLGY